MQNEGWTEGVNPFPQATLGAQELAKDVEQIVGTTYYRANVTGPPPDDSHFNLLKVGLPGYITEYLDNDLFTEFYTEEDKINLIRLGEALERLAAGKLTLQDTEAITTITGKGLASVWQVEKQQVFSKQRQLEIGPSGPEAAERIMWRDEAELQGIRNVRYLLEKIADQLSEEVTRQQGLGNSGRT